MLEDEESEDRSAMRRTLSGSEVGSGTIGSEFKTSSSSSSPLASPAHHSPFPSAHTRENLSRLVDKKRLNRSSPEKIKSPEDQGNTNSWQVADGRRRTEDKRNLVGSVKRRLALRTSDKKKDEEREMETWIQLRKDSKRNKKNKALEEMAAFALTVLSKFDALQLSKDWKRFKKGKSLHRPKSSTITPKDNCSSIRLKVGLHIGRALVGSIPHSFYEGSGMALSLDSSPHFSNLLFWNKGEGSTRCQRYGGRPSRLPRT